MRRLSYVLALILALGAGAAEAAPAAKYKVPRTREGQPDLQGLWTNTAVTMLQRAPMFKNLVLTDKEAAMMEGGFQQFVGELIKPDPIDPNKPAPPVVKTVDNSDFIEMSMKVARVRGEPRSSWIVEPADGRLPLTDDGRKAGRALAKDSFEGPEGRPLTERCLVGIGSPEGPPMMNTGFNGHYQIVQTKDHVAIHVEMNHDVRIVRLTDRAHPPETMRQWLGDSVGWFEGDTLVVETSNFHPSHFVASLGGGFTLSRKAKLTERFTRTGKDEMLYEFAVDDPLHFKSVWRAEMPFRTAKGPIYEYACHEGNYSLANALTGARYEERQAVAAKVAEAKPADTKPATKKP